MSKLSVTMYRYRRRRFAVYLQLPEGAIGFSLKRGLLIPKMFD